MAGLLGLLDLGASSLHAQRAGVAVTGRNTANVETEGYTRESIDVRSRRGAPLVGGVSFNGPVRVDTALIDRREREVAAGIGFGSALSASISELEGALTSDPDGLSGRLASLFGSVANLASTPTDEIVRADTINKAEALATAFNRHASAIADARDEADARVSEGADDATALAAEIAATNIELAISQDPVIEDRRALAARRLSQIVGGEARVDADGKMRFVLPGGAVLVDGDRAASLEATPDPATGFARLEVVDGVHRADVTAQLSSGSIAGDIHFRDVAAANSADRLDALAKDLIDAFNAVHSAGAALDGSTGRAFFTGTNATDIAVDATVAGDPRLLAAAAVGSPARDNTNALALLDLSSAVAPSSNRSFTDESIGVIADLGRAGAAASRDLDHQEALGEAVAATRDSLVGVSLQDEMAKLSQLQHAAHASTQFIRVVDELIATVIQMV